MTLGSRVALLQYLSQPVLDVERDERFLRDRARQVLLDRGVARERRHRLHVSLGVEDRPSSPESGHGDGEAEHGEDEHDRREDGADLPPACGPVLELLDTLLECIAFCAELVGIIRVGHGPPKSAR